LEEKKIHNEKVPRTQGKENHRKLIRAGVMFQKKKYEFAIVYFLSLKISKEGQELTVDEIYGLRNILE
jgi:hypothetical protein